MRQLLSDKKVKKLIKQTELPIVKVMVRGGTDHRKDICLEDGSIVSMDKDGYITVCPFPWKATQVNGTESVYDLLKKIATLGP